LAAAVERYIEEFGGELTDVLARVGDPIEEARSLLSADEHARAVEEGRAMSVEEAVGYGLGPEPTANTVEGIPGPRGAADPVGPMRTR